MNWFKISQLMKEDTDYFQEFSEYGDYVPDFEKVNIEIENRLQTKIKNQIASGDSGIAYLLENGNVLKITTSSKEGQIAHWISQNPNEYIVNIYDVWQMGDLYYIHMEYIDQMASSFPILNQIFNQLKNILNRHNCTNISCALPILKNNDFFIKLPNDLKNQIIQYISHLMNVPKNLTPFDYLNVNNIGIKNGKLKFFDVN